MIFMRIFVNNKELINKIIKSSTTEADTHPDHDHEEQHLEVHQEDLPTPQEPLKEEIKEEVKEEHHVLHHDKKRLNNDISKLSYWIFILKLRRKINLHLFSFFILNMLKSK